MGTEIEAALQKYDFIRGEYVFQGKREVEIALESQIYTQKMKFLAAVEPLSVTIQQGNFNKEIKRTAGSIMNKCLVLVNTPTIPTLYKRAFINWLEGASAKDHEGIFMSMEAELNQLEILLR